MIRTAKGGPTKGVGERECLADALLPSAQHVRMYHVTSDYGVPLTYCVLAWLVGWLPGVARALGMPF